MSVPAGAPPDLHKLDIGPSFVRLDVHPHVLDPTDCMELINEARYQVVDTGVLTDEDDWRTAQGAWLQRPLPVLEKLRAAVAVATGLPVANQEGAHVVRYDVGGEYKAHDDGFHPGEPYFDGQIRMGGQRAFSCMVWLNDDYLGGQTEFATLARLYSPSVGDMLVWSNLTDTGTLDLVHRHAGLPVSEGVKWIVIVWVREHEFRPLAQVAP